MNGFAFEHPYFLLLAAPTLWLGWQRLRARPAALLTSSLAVARQVAPGLRARLHALPDLLRILAALLLVVAMARPQRVDRELLSGDGIDIMIALDMSGSMNAIDVPEAEIEKLQARGEEPQPGAGQGAGGIRAVSRWRGSRSGLPPRRVRRRRVRTPVRGGGSRGHRR